MAAPAFMAHAAMHAAGTSLHGPLNAIRLVSNMAAPLEYPSAHQIIEQHVRGLITDEQLSSGLLRVGVALDVSGQSYNQASISHELWVNEWLSAQRRQEGAELNEVANRFFFTDQQLDSRLANLGWFDPTIRAQQANLRYDIPGPADLVRFSVRHVWEPDLLAAIGYDQEFPGPILDVWHAMKGLDYSLFTGPFRDQISALTGQQDGAFALANTYAEAGVSEPTWAKAYWWSHWVLPSPGQFFGFLIKLDPERDRSFDPPEAVGLDFTLEDYELGLRANDYPPKYRPMLAAINRPIVGIRFLRDFVKQGVYSYADIIEWARRWGYSPRDQKDIADDVWRNVQATEEKRTACKGCATCDAAFEVGILDTDNLLECYVGYGMDPKVAGVAAGLAQLKLKVKRAREVVANIRRRFLRGTVTPNDAMNLLRGYGISMDRVQEYIFDWGLELEAGRKEISAAKAVQYACKGLITIQDLVARLTNLGYSRDDQSALVGEANACAANLQLQAVAAADKKAKQLAAEAYTAQRRARQQMLEAQQALAKHGSPNQLRKWFCEGAIGETEVFSRLNFLGWPDTDITRLLSDCKQKAGG